MGILGWTWLIVGLSFALYVVLTVYGTARTTSEFYVAERRINPVLNGMATASDWMSAATFMSMAGLIAFMGRDGSMYLMGWTGGYVLLAILLAPYLRKYGKYTVPQFVGERYYSSSARVIALVCAIFISFTYVAGQMRGVGIVFARFFDVSIDAGVVLGMVVVFLYTALGGMRGITYTQVAQYVVVVAAYLVPAIFISIMLTGNAVPQLGFGDTIGPEGAKALGVPSGAYLLDTLDRISTDLGFPAYTSGWRPRIDVLFVTLSLMVGTAGLPHVIIRFFTVPKIRDARASVGWALLFISVLYTAAPAVAAFARIQIVQGVNGKAYAQAPGWFKSWEKNRLVSFADKNGDGVMRLSADPAKNEVEIDRDIVVLANPEMARLPPWVIALVAAGALAAAMSTAAGLLLVIAAAISHDLMKGVFRPKMSENAELWWARIAVAGAVALSGYFGVNPPGYVAQTVAFAFGLAASSFFPAVVAGIFWKGATKEGAIAGMVAGVLFTAAYIVFFRFVRPDLNSAEHWWFEVSPEGIGTVGMLLNVAVLVGVSWLTPPPPQQVQDLVESLRYPKQARPRGTLGVAAKRPWN